MGELFDRFDAEPQRGIDITMGTHFPEIFVSEQDEIIYYLGICLNKDRAKREIYLEACPYYMEGKHSNNKKIADEIYGFLRLIDGCIVFEDYVDGCRYKSERLYKRITHAGIRYPCADTYYAVFHNGKEDYDLTRAVFGLSYDELCDFLEVYAKVLGRLTDYTQSPRITRSMKSINFCEITDGLIPRRFPYISFDNGGREFSCVSLWGFYRHIQLLTQFKINSAIGQIFLKAGLDEGILKRIFEIGNNIFYQEKVVEFSIKQR